MPKRRVVSTLLVADGVLWVLVGLLFDETTLLNTQIGFLSSALVILASMQSYRRMVDTRVAHEVITTDIDKDVIDKLEDPHDLYSAPIETTPVEDIGSAIKEEKRRLKANRRSLGETLRDTKAALSLYRLGGYVVLILGFMYLQRHGMLSLLPYLIAIGLPPFIVAGVLVGSQPTHTQDGDV